MTSKKGALIGRHPTIDAAVCWTFNTGMKRIVPDRYGAWFVLFMWSMPTSALAGLVLLVSRAGDIGAPISNEHMV